MTLKIFRVDADCLYNEGCDCDVPMERWEGMARVILAADVDRVVEELRERVNELEADRCVNANGIRMLARYCLSKLPAKHTTHGEGEIYNVARAAMTDTTPHTTPWLVTMMEVARVDKKDLPQELYKAKADLARVTAELEKAKEYISGKYGLGIPYPIGGEIAPTQREWKGEST